MKSLTAHPRMGQRLVKASHGKTSKIIRLDVSVDIRQHFHRMQISVKKDVSKRGKGENLFPGGENRWPRDPRQYDISFLAM